MDLPVRIFLIMPVVRTARRGCVAMTTLDATRGSLYADLSRRVES